MLWWCLDRVDDSSQGQCRCNDVLIAAVTSRQELCYCCGKVNLVLSRFEFGVVQVTWVNRTTADSLQNRCFWGKIKKLTCLLICYLQSDQAGHVSEERIQPILAFAQITWFKTSQHPSSVFFNRRILGRVQRSVCFFLLILTFSFHAHLSYQHVSYLLIKWPIFFIDLLIEWRRFLSILTTM